MSRPLIRSRECPKLRRNGVCSYTIGKGPPIFDVSPVEVFRLER